jgi:hypothetical protein
MGRARGKTSKHTRRKAQKGDTRAAEARKRAKGIRDFEARMAVLKKLLNILGINVSPPCRHFHECRQCRHFMLAMGVKQDQVFSGILRLQRELSELLDEYAATLSEDQMGTA